MSATFCWEVKKTTRNSFRWGTSSDQAALETIFGGECSTADIKTLRAMHAALRAESSLWSEIADKLEALQGDDYDKEVTLKIWTEY
jgi:hypothetical protein